MTIIWFFSNFFLNYQKVLNIIWEIHNLEGEVVRYSNDKVEIGVPHFSPLFKGPQGCPIQEIIYILIFFPRATFDETNEALEDEVSKEEILEALSSLKK